MANTHSLDLEASSSQYASITDASQSGLDITGDMTIECWIKPESSPSSAILVSKYGVSSYSFKLWQTSTSIALTLTSDGAGVNSSFISHSITVGVWQHIAVTYKASSGLVTLYINSTSTGTATNTKTSIFNSSADFEIGSNRSGNNTYDGLIDEVRIWDDVRTATEIADNYQTELVGDEANLQGYWRFNNDYTDETSNGNDLTASGSPVFSTDVPFSSAAPDNALSMSNF